MSSPTASKKRKTSPAVAGAPGARGRKPPTTSIRPLERTPSSQYMALSLQDIYDHLAALCPRVPPVPESGFVVLAADGECNGDSAGPGSGGEDATPLVTSLATAGAAPGPTYDRKAIRAWAAALQTVLEEFHLLVSLISPATYVWGTDRSGAADQNLGLLSSELVRSQEQIAARVAPRLNDVLAPVVTLITTKTVTVRRGDTETKHNYYATTVEDPDYVASGFAVLAQHAGLLRHVVLANFEKLLLALQDYASAQHTDSQHDSRGLLY